MQNILWKSFQKNWTSMQDIPPHVHPPQWQGLQRFPAGPGVLTFPPWSCCWPSSIRPRSSPQSFLFNSLNSFLMFQEDSHQPNRLWGSSGFRHQEERISTGLGRGDMYYTNVCLKVSWRTWSGLLVALSHVPICWERDRGHKNPWGSCSFSEQHNMGSWGMRPVWIYLAAWSLHYVFIEHLLCANYSRNWSHEQNNKVSHNF